MGGCVSAWACPHDGGAFHSPDDMPAVSACPEVSITQVASACQAPQTSSAAPSHPPYTPRGTSRDGWRGERSACRLFHPQAQNPRKWLGRRELGTWAIVSLLSPVRERNVGRTSVKRDCERWHVPPTRVAFRYVSECIPVFLSFHRDDIVMPVVVTGKTIALRPHYSLPWRARWKRSHQCRSNRRIVSAMAACWRSSSMAMRRS
jgi:hypothetical protein